MRSVRAVENGSTAGQTPVVTGRTTSEIRSDSGPQSIGPATWGLIGVTLIPVFVELLRVFAGLGSAFHAVSDNALNELVVRDIGRYPVLLGPYSRSLWSHPGPLFYYVAVIPYRVFGANSSAMLGVALLINGFAIGGMIAIARRWGGTPLAVPVGIVCGALVVHLPTGSLENPWNPYVTVLPFGLFLLAAWAATCGDGIALGIAAFSGSFCVQTHLAYAPVVLVVLAWSALRLIRDRSSVSPRALKWATIILAVVWFPPLLEQLVRSPGNIRSIGHYFLHPDYPTHSLIDGLRVVGAQFDLRADWIRGFRGFNRSTGEPLSLTSRIPPLPVLLIPFGLAIVAAVRAGRRPSVRLASTLVVSGAAAVFAASQTVGGMFEYRMRWLWVIGALSVAYAASEAVRFALARAPAQRSLIAAVGVFCVGVLAVVGTIRAVDTGPPGPERSRVINRLARQVAHHLGPRARVTVVRTQSITAGDDISGLVLSLERSDVDVRVEPTDLNRLIFGEHRIDHSRHPRLRLMVAADAEIEGVAAQPGARRIAFVSRFTESQRTGALRNLRPVLRRGGSPFAPNAIAFGRYLYGRAVFAVPQSRPRLHRSHAHAADTRVRDARG